ncbi:MAG: hypothetical protein HN742_12630 [Lentisphaerae bacterium]|jgi:hypothetical protein|nr:hypothetical protein [Lentisphaerota bacterium]MBT5607127.1 hypothetical protein [Lentisphaerota bacterium]MBT7053529.1 hypothetical protein [Lentisphaerota bacterium]MBT7842715.1 hypothetical protein [Lentisphaerota bacterium]
MPRTTPRSHIPATALALVACFNALAWRSEFYPERWEPGQKDAQGRFLHDFSYAGYHRGEVPLPDPAPGKRVDVTAPPYNADATGKRDATTAIQRALDDLGERGGGVVHLPKGTYRLSLPAEAPCTLRIKHPHTVLSGAGPERTFLLHTGTLLRGKSVVLIRAGKGTWRQAVPGSEIAISRDVPAPAFEIPLASVGRMKKGDWVVLRSDWTQEFINDHGMQDYWKPGSWPPGPLFCRQIVAVDPVASVVRIDAPTRYVLKTRDRARIHRIPPMLTEVGVENLSIGNAEHTGQGWSDSDFSKKGTGAHDVHGSHVMRIDHVLNGWLRNVHSYRSPTNRRDVHMLSNGILIGMSSCVTVQGCVMQKPQYEGGGGDGYGFTLHGNDCLVTRCEAVHTRHNYDFKLASSNGNVIHRSTGRVPRFSSDFHMYFSMANLFDSMLMDGDWLQGVFRPWGGPRNYHGHPTTESVFWNTRGTAAGKRGYIVESQQFGWGFVIGTSGVKDGVRRGVKGSRGIDSSPEDVLEGQGKGETLVPQSLYEDQLVRRLRDRPTIRCARRPAHVSDTSATIAGKLSGARNQTVDVKAYWGRVDAGSNEGRWEFSQALEGRPEADAFRCELPDLLPGTRYYFRMTAANTAGRLWAPQSGQLTTTGDAPSSPPPLTIGTPGNAPFATVAEGRGAPPLPVTDGLIARFSATTFSGADGALVRAWPDASSKAHTFRGSGNMPQLVMDGIGGHPTIRFDGLSTLKAGTLRPEVGPVHIFIVAKGTLTGGPEFQRVFATHSGRGKQWESPNIDLQRPREPNGTPKPFSAQLLVYRSADGRSLRSVTLGAKARSDYGYFAGDIAEILIYGRTLTGREEAQVKEALSQHYQLP